MQNQTKLRINKDITWELEHDEHNKQQDQINNILKTQLDIDKVTQISLLNNFDLQAKYNQLGISQANLVQSGFISNPTLTIERRFPGRAAEFDIVENFMSLILLPLKKDLAETEFESTKLKLTSEIVKHVFELKKLWITFTANNNIQLVFKDKYQTALAVLEYVKELRKSGNINEVELQTFEQEVAELKLEMLKLKIENIQLKELLNTTMGLVGEQINWRTSEKLYEVPKNELLSNTLENEAIKNRPDYLALNQEFIAAGKQVGIINITSYIPELNITSHFEKEPDDGTSSTGPSVDIPLPLFDLGSAQRGLAESLHKQAKNMYKALEVKIRAEVRSAQSQMELHKETVSYTENFLLPLQKKKLEQSQLLYNGMFLSATDLLKYKIQELNSKIILIESTKNYWLSRIDLENSLGKELPFKSSYLNIQESKPAFTMHNHHHK